MRDFRQDQNCAFLHFYSILFYLHRNPVKLKLIFLEGIIILKSLPLYLTKLMVLSFGIISSLLAINFIAFLGVAPCNLVDYMSFVVEFVTWAACNSVMYFDLYSCSSQLFKLSHSNSLEITYKLRTFRKQKHGK
jgi:hypothetical protein